MIKYKKCIIEKVEKGYIVFNAKGVELSKAKTQKEAKKIINEIPKIIPKWNKDNIKTLLLNNDEMVKKSLIKIYERQTMEEQTSGETREQNGIGFNGLDAPILTDIADFYTRTNYMSKAQIELVRKKLVKYTGQLVSIANEGGN